MTSRRDFIKKVAATGSLSLAIPPLWATPPPQKQQSQKAEKGFTFLFQGDSITDGNRTRNNDLNHVLGHGYAYLISSKLSYNSPEKEFLFLNRGISGNQVTDLANRWQTDTIELKPDLLSIMIGVNDAWAAVGGDKTRTVELFESTYRSILEKTRQALPSVQFVLCTPFVLPAGPVKKQWDSCQIEVAPRIAVIRQLADEYNAVFVDFQTAFNAALKRAPAEYWLWDGVHPMPAGHELMAREWIKQVRKKFRFVS
jgi:lysophospholipase L1-like esterase